MDKDSFEPGALSGGADWISPAWATLMDIANGGGYRFSIMPCHLSPREIEKLLRSRGVKTWGLVQVVAGNRALLSVRKQDAPRAYSILNQAGVPIENPPPQPRRARKAQGRARQSGGVFSVFDVFER